MLPGLSRYRSLLSKWYILLQPSQQPNPDDAVQAALQKVSEAAQIAEQQLHKLEELPSARMPRQVCHLLLRRCKAYLLHSTPAGSNTSTQDADTCTAVHASILFAAGYMLQQLTT